MSARDITRVLFALLALITCVVAAPARAASELELDYPKIAGCPSRAQTIARIEEQLGRPLGEVDDALRASVRVTRSALGYALTVETDHAGAHGERAFQAARCEEVHDAAVLVLVLSLGQAEQARAEQQRPPEPEPEPEPAPKPEQAGKRVEKPAPKKKRAPPQFSMRVGATLEGGFLPGAGLGTEAVMSLHVARSHIELGGLWLFPKDSPAQKIDGSKVQVSLYTGRVNYCHDLIAVRRNQLGMCGGVELGQAVGKGIGLASSLSRTFLWSAGWLSLRLTSQLLPHFGLVLEPAIGIPFANHRFVSTTPSNDRVVPLHEPQSTSKRITLGAAFLF